MLARLSSTLVLWTVILGGLYFFGAHAAVVLATLLAVLTLHEFYCLTAKMGARAFHGMGLFFAALMIAGPYYLAWFTDEAEVPGSVATSLLVLALLVACIRSLRERNTANRIDCLNNGSEVKVYIVLRINAKDILYLCLQGRSTSCFICSVV